MANEVLKRDQNDVTVLGAVTNDSDQFIKMLRIDPATGRLIVSAVIAGTYNGQLLVSAADTTYGYLFSKLTAGTGISLAITNAGGNETVEITATGTGYTTVQNNGNPLTQRTKLNFLNGFDVTDNAGNTSTDVVIDESELDLGLMGGLLDLSTQVTGVLNSTYIDISNLESNLDLANIAGLLNISSQVTGVLPLANGGTGSALTDPNANRLLGWDDTDGAIGFWTLGTGLSYDHATHTLTATAGGQTSIQFQDQGSNLGAAGTVNEVDFVGVNVTATRATDKVTVTIGGVEGITGNYIDNTDPVNPVSEVPLNNTTNTTPTVNDDSGDGYAVDSKWFNTVTGYLYTCTDATVGAAVWEQVVSADSSLYKIGAGNISNINWFNGELSFVQLDGGADAWTIANPSGVLTESKTDLTTNTTCSIEDWCVDWATGGVLNFNSGKQVIVQGIVVYDAVDDKCGWGFGDAIWNCQGAANNNFGFVTDAAGAFYTYTGAVGGVTYTETPITSLSSGTHVLRIEVDPANATPQIRFYVDGVLVSTHTTNVATNENLDFSLGNSGGAMNGILAVSSISYAIEI